MGIKTHVLLAAALVASMAAAEKEKALPSSWKLCSRDDPQINSCLKDAINFVIESIGDTGVRELKVFPLEPFRISQMSVAQGTGPVAINLELNDVDITGIKDVRFKTIESDLDHYKIKGALEPIPRVNLKGNYKINGRMLLLPISGEGKCELTMKNINSNIVISGEPLVKNGRTYMNVTNFEFPLYPEAFSINFENLFNGNKQLSDQMNKVMNDNWQVILNEVRPTVTEAFSVAWKDTANRILLRVPYDKIFKQ